MKNTYFVCLQYGVTWKLNYPIFIIYIYIPLFISIRSVIEKGKPDKLLKSC